MDSDTQPDALKSVLDGIDNRGYDIVGIKIFKKGFRVFEDLSPGRVVNSFTGLPPPDEFLEPIGLAMSASWNNIKNQRVLSGFNPPAPDFSKFVPKF